MFQVSVEITALVVTLATIACVAITVDGLKNPPLALVCTILIVPFSVLLVWLVRDFYGRWVDAKFLYEQSGKPLAELPDHNVA